MDKLKFMWSKIDHSINVVFPDGREARYVRRKPEYYAIYVSSQLGCNKACRMCHLTQTGQTNNQDVDHDGIMEQIQILDKYVKKNIDKIGGNAPLVHLNFMARGEPFSNKQITTRMAELLERISQYYKEHGQEVRFNFSTIMPEETGTHYFKEWFQGTEAYNVHVYYSMYSLDPEFRKRWLPKAIDPYRALTNLRLAQLDHNVNVALHWALIKDENDGISTPLDLMKINEVIGLQYKFNLVRYNPYSKDQGDEAWEEVRASYFTYMEQIAPIKRSKIIGRVGMDVKASCGMFVKTRTENSKESV